MSKNWLQVLAEQRLVAVTAIHRLGWVVINPSYHVLHDLLHNLASVFRHGLQQVFDVGETQWAALINTKKDTMIGVVISQSS